MSDLKSELRGATDPAQSFNLTWMTLKRLRQRGFGRADVQSALHELLGEASSEVHVERIEDALDIVTGWCNPEQSIWDLSEELFAVAAPFDVDDSIWKPRTVLLLTVESRYGVDEGLAVLPALRGDILAEAQARSLAPNHRLVLELPDGGRLLTFIAALNVATSISTTPQNASSAPLIVVLPKGISQCDAPIGTQVWLYT